MSDKPVRIQFEVPHFTVQEIDRFEEEAWLSSHRELFANLMTLWRWAANKSREGKIIAAIDPKTMKAVELSFPTLETIRIKAAEERQRSTASSSNTAT